MKNIQTMFDNDFRSNSTVASQLSTQLNKPRKVGDINEK